VKPTLRTFVAASVASSLFTVSCQSAPPVAPRRGPSTPPAEAPIWPRRLAAGDTIMFVAPAGPLDRQRMERARRRLEERGYRVIQRDDLFASEGYLAGSDSRRAAELMQAFLDPEVDAIFPGTGGYGTMRLFDLLDFEAIRRHPKIVVGFSDLTALHAALNRRAGLVTFHSPNPMWGLGNEEGMAAFSEAYFFRALTGVPTEAGAGYTIELPPEAAPVGVWGHGRARGRLVGGNLSMLSALEGTPYALDTRGAILLIEDVREAPYRVDRMLRQLQLAGKLAILRGAVLGQFTLNYDREDDQQTPDPRFTVDGVLHHYFAEAGIPVLTNFPVGHHEFNVTLPLGGLVEVDADAGVLRVLPPGERF
jgi:muramoyltetrapeptide carboxypeptidase